MKRVAPILIFALLGCLPQQTIAQQLHAPVHFDFYGQAVEFPLDSSFLPDLATPLNSLTVQSFCAALDNSDYKPVMNSLLEYRKKFQPDDWLYYQLIRKTAQAISPKAGNYFRYTIYKWFLLSRAGYATSLRLAGDKLLLYVQSNEDVYEIPFYLKNGQQYVCLNYHDYQQIDFTKEQFTEVAAYTPETARAFSYRVTRLPEFRDQDYREKELSFNLYQNEYHFKIKLNSQVQTIFANYPTVDYASSFNIPLSRETYSSLIPLLKETIKGWSTKNGVDFLMRFTRYSFLFETDTDNFGKEKRLTPEQTLFYEHSDCEDRSALFFYLVKEIYNLPMIILSYPKHITVAVQFDKPVGTPIFYKGNQYSVCEPTPQKKDLRVGQLLPELQKEAFEVVYAYKP